MNFIIVLLMFSIIVLFHEAGHFSVAKLMGTEIQTFSIGFGPELFGFSRNGIRYKICLIPLGGYVQMQDLLELPWYKSALIAVAGPLANLVLFYVTLLSIIYVVNFHDATLLQAFGLVNHDCVEIIKSLLHITSKDIELVSPIGVAAGMPKNTSWEDYLNLFLALDLSLGILNLLPFPMLDGFLLFTSFLEPVIGKQRRKLFFEYSTIVGFYALVGLMAYVVGKDIFRLFVN